MCLGVWYVGEGVLPAGFANRGMNSLLGMPPEFIDYFFAFNIWFQLILIENLAFLSIFSCLCGGGDGIGHGSDVLKVFHWGMQHASMIDSGFLSLAP